MRIVIFGAGLIIAAWVALVLAIWSTSKPPTWHNPPLAGIQLAFLDNAQRSGGIVGDADDNGVQDEREDHGWLDRAWRGFLPSPRYQRDGFSSAAPRSEGYGRSDHGGHERN